MTSFVLVLRKVTDVQGRKLLSCVSPPQESHYIFRDGLLPPHRQMFYQLCDLEVDRFDTHVFVLSFKNMSCAPLFTADSFVPVNAAFCPSSIKELIERNSGKEQDCDERDGWCVVGTTDKLRDIISTMIKKVVREKKPGVVKRTSMHQGTYTVTFTRSVVVV